MYTGALFVAAKNYAESECSDWFIISAKHGLLRPDTVIGPYEARLPRRGDEREGWGIIVASKLLERINKKYPGKSDHWELPSYRVVLLAGEEYADPIRRHLDRLRVPHESPLKGMQIGERLAWFKAQREVAP